MNKAALENVQQKDDLLELLKLNSVKSLVGC